MILLVRHAIAVARRSWEGDDDLRPLTPRGERQAVSLPVVLRPFAIDRLVSSPAVRCTATLGPLAEVRSLAVEERDHCERAEVTGPWTSSSTRLRTS